MISGTTAQLKKNSRALDKIGFFSPLAGVGTDCGYGYAAVELITAWQRMGIPVWAYDRDAPVIFNFGQPHFYERVEGKLNIGYTPWESNKVPESWVMYMNLMDEIWTPCQANKEWYIDAGVDVPVKVLPHGVNPEHYPLRRRNENVTPIRFLHIGEPSPRKGGKLAYEVFKDTFGDSSAHATLTLKGKPRFKVHGQNVRVISDRYTQDEMRDLYLDHDAMIYPTNGEGFGFIPFQGAATGMPTLVTNWSGPVDFMKGCYPLPILGLIEPDYEPHEGLWADPDPRYMAQWMVDVVARPWVYFDHAYEKGQYIQDNWNWDLIANSAIEMMLDSLNKLGS